MSPLRRALHTAAAVAFALAMGGLGAGLGYYVAYRPPVVVLKVDERDGVAMRGGWLELDVTLKRDRLCNPHVDRWLWQWRDGLKYWVALPPIATPPVSLSKTVRYTLAIPIPGDVSPGEWFYMSRTHEDCPNPFTLTPAVVRDGRDIPVTIQDPPAGGAITMVAPPGPVTIEASPSTAPARAAPPR